MNETKEKNGVLFNILLITIFFNVWFPKAGIKISEIPITIGNILFGFIFLLWILSKIRTKKLIFPIIGLALIVLEAYSLIKYIAIGNVKENIGFIIPIVIYPLIFFMIYDLTDSKKKLYQILKVIMYGFFFLSIYALLQYTFGVNKVCIPGLTVNLSDYNKYGENWFMKKNNRNGGGVGTKIISTYQNGNLFGVNLLMIYPLAFFYLKKINKNKELYFSLVLFVLCLFLTLSRSCWIGVILFIFLGILFNNEKITKLSITRKILLLLFTGLIIAIAFKYFPSIATRFSNTNDWMSMSGRKEGLISVITSFWNYKNPLIWLIGSNGIISDIGLAYEMTPLALLVQIGLIGVVLFYYILIKTIVTMSTNDEIEKAIKLSVLIWILVGFIEGAFWLTPTSINLFMIVAIGLSYKKMKGN